MAFQPSTNIFIGTVPFDQSYRHVHYIPDRTQQQMHFSSLCPTGFRRGDYTYQREHNAVVVPWNAELLYGYNYCMFQNENYGDRWFYSFINSTEYVGPEQTRLHLSEDIMQTWFPDCTVKSCMVQREHVNDDTIGAHIKDEGLDPGELKCTYYAIDNNDMDCYMVVSCAVEPLKDGTYVNNGGDKYMGVMSGTSLTVFLTVDQLKGFMQALSDNGQQDAISAVYMVPRAAIPNIVAKSNGWGYWVDANSATPSTEMNYQLGFTTLDGYAPKNNKMYCYPFEYAEVTNFTGQTQQLRLEFCGTPGTVTLQKTGGCDVNSRLMYIPLNYNGVNRFVEGCIYLDAYPTCNWVYQAFANAVGQSQVDMMGWKFNSMTELPFINNMVDSAQTLTGKAAGLDFLGMGSATVDAVQDQTNAFAALSKASRQPNTARGGTNSTAALVNIGSYTMGIRKYTARAEIAKQIDDYLSVYGYNVSVNKVPNITGRASWNYVKTNGSSITGKVPANVLAQINSLFDRGITFWHTNDVGNYALPNGIV